MSVSLLTVWRAARARALPFPGESAGYLVFLACEELAVAPRSVNLANVGLDADGRVWVRGREAADDERAERDLRTLLRQLVEVASSPGIALVRAAQRTPSGSLTAFSSELSKALIPFNRAAARRALIRLYRETERAVAEGELADEPPALSASGPHPPVVERPESTPAAEVPAEPEPASEPEQPEPEPALTLPLVVERPQKGPIAPSRILSLGDHVLELASIPEVEHPTRPEPLAARRRLASPSEAPRMELTQPLPVAPARPCTPMPPPVSAVGERTLAPPISEEERTPTLGFLEPSPETPPLGSLSTTAPSDEPFVFDLVYGDTTERVPPVSEPEPAQVADELLEWPVELAGSGPAIPLESERDALPRLPEPDAAAAADAPTPEAGPYGGLRAEKSDVRKLLSGFRVAAALPESDVRGELKRLAGLDETPKPG